MKIRKEYMILGVVIIALVLYLVFHETDRAQYELPALPKVASKDINKLEIQQSNITIILSKKDNRWYIAPKNYPADNSTVSGMLDALEELTLTALASESKSYSRYDLGAEKKIHAKAWIGETLAREIEIGKAVPTYQHTFIHLIDDPNVYHASGNFRNKFDKTVEQLRDKAVLSIEREQIRTIRVAKGEDTKTFTLGTIPVDITKSEDGKESDAAGSPEAKMEWMTADNRKADQTTIDSLLGMLTRLKCDAYQDTEEKDDSINPSHLIEISGAKSATLSIFAKEDKDADRYPAVSSDNDYPFFLSGFQGNNILEKIDTLLESSE